MKVQADLGKPLGYVQLTSLGSAANLGTIPTGARYALMVAEAQALRWRDDGTNPTASAGMPLATGVEFLYDGADLTAFKVIEQTAGGKLNVTFYGRA